jgi:hypothetical protein
MIVFLAGLVAGIIAFAVGMTWWIIAVYRSERTR